MDTVRRSLSSGHEVSNQIALERKLSAIEKKVREVADVAQILERTDERRAIDKATIADLSTDFRYGTSFLKNQTTPFPVSVLNSSQTCTD